jgi:hypothetical protein
MVMPTNLFILKRSMNWYQFQMGLQSLAQLQGCHTSRLATEVEAMELACHMPQCNVPYLLPAKLFRSVEEQTINAVPVTVTLDYG